MNIEPSAGRTAFGLDPQGYDQARPPYPDWVFDRIDAYRSILNAKIFEIGAGTGLATHQFMARGAAALTAIEPDPNLARMLRDRPSPGLHVLEQAFESSSLTEGAFDLGIAATSFHWLDQAEALTKVAGLLRPGGVFAAFANVFGDPLRPDGFHEATQDLLGGLPTSPSAGLRGLPYALDAEARLGDLHANGAFTDITTERQDWTLMINAVQVRALYATYSNITLRPAAERESLLDALELIARDQFDGHVERNMVTTLYLARRI